MSFKSKDLHYEKQEPAFLRKLRGEYGGVRDNVQNARPSKPRLELGDDDGPTIVDEEGRTVSKEQYEALTHAGDQSTAEALSNADDKKSETPLGTEPFLSGPRRPNQEKAASIGASSKRKQARIVGDDHASHEFQETGDSARTGVTKQSEAKSKTKKKKIKLSFDDEGS